MKIRFGSYIKDHYFTLRCTPVTTARQRIERAEVAIEPAESRAEDTDSFGNRLILGHTLAPHTSFRVTLTGEATTGLECYEEMSERDEMIFSYFSKATYPGDHLSYYHSRLMTAAPDGVYNKALYFMRCIYRDFSYCSGATSVSTTAENAVALGQGVCQDYAHIMLAICRMERIPARYVVGMMMGEGFSHAWVEVKCGKYWYGFDPTNNYLVDDGYVKISHGRDFFDCIVNKGIYHNPAIEIQEIGIAVNDIGERSNNT